MLFQPGHKIGLGRQAKPHGAALPHLARNIKRISGFFGLIFTHHAVVRSSAHESD
jgi:hypothetical protein